MLRGGCASDLAAEGAEWIQIDEPVLTLDLSDEQRAAIQTTFERLSVAAGSSKIMVATYFGELRENLSLLLGLPVAAVHVDAVRGADELDRLLSDFPADKELSLGVVDGRNIWKNDYDASLAKLRRAQSVVGPERLWVAPSSSLQHSPITLANEPKLDGELKSWLAFADQKLVEVVALREILAGPMDPRMLEENQAAQAARRSSPRIHNPAVKSRMQGIQPADFDRVSSFAERQSMQRKKLNLPLFPTTTIGSFPQTAEVRSARPAGNVAISPTRNTTRSSRTRSSAAWSSRNPSVSTCRSTASSSATTWSSTSASSSRATPSRPTAGCRATARAM